MSEVGGLWKHQNNPACTKSVKSLQNGEVGLYAKEEHGDTLVLHSEIQGHVGVTQQRNTRNTGTLWCYIAKYWGTWVLHSSEIQGIQGHSGVT